MKNSKRRNIRRRTTPFGITLLVALAVSGLTGLFRDAITEASTGRENNTSVSGSSAPDEATRARITEAYGKLPMSFEANEGQTDRRVKFLSRGNGYTLFLTSSEAVLSLRRPEETSNKSSATDGGDRKKKGEWGRGDVLRMRLVGARLTPRVEGGEELSVRSNYFIGNDPQKWRTDVRQYAKVATYAVAPLTPIKLIQTVTESATPATTVELLPIQGRRMLTTMGSATTATIVVQGQTPIRLMLMVTESETPATTVAVRGSERIQRL